MPRVEHLGLGVSSLVLSLVHVGVQHLGINAQGLPMLGCRAPDELTTRSSPVSGRPPGVGLRCPWPTVELRPQPYFCRSPRRLLSPRRRRSGRWGCRSRPRRPGGPPPPAFCHPRPRFPHLRVGAAPDSSSGSLRPPSSDGLPRSRNRARCAPRRCPCRRIRNNP